MKVCAPRTRGWVWVGGRRRKRMSQAGMMPIAKQYENLLASKKEAKLRALRARHAKASGGPVVTTGVVTKGIEDPEGGRHLNAGLKDLAGTALLSPLYFRFPYHISLYMR